MSRRRFRERMILEGVRVKRPAACQSAEPAGELRAPSVEVVGAKLIDGEEDDERRRARGIRKRTRRPLGGTTLSGQCGRGEK